ncbi:hypothetical protein G3I60_03640 [Streptomyces sp. SID13666]|uniref:hypothetical protein n=1 Tax=unclassified Streptomyces TaxID=2593676 RepID=UPI0013C1BD86|nr:MULTISPECIES: hypothetical protein [unclassified Streptomyces]NEA53283.1 hypothetical protein [Streptomyces sp. SID13666]NEA69390.1 hypothetical protein [Streptomyces sp. SID13588]
MTTMRIGAERAAGGSPPSPRGAGRNRLVGAALIVLSLVTALTCAFVFTSWLPTDGALYREYRAAEVCSVRTVIPASEDCLRELSFTVEGTHKTAKNMRATLLGPRPFGRVVVPFSDSGPTLSGLQKGDRVTATVWRGVVVMVAEGDARQHSADAPRDEPQMTAAVGTFAGLLAALAFMFGAMHLVRPRDPGLFTWRPYGKWLLIVTGATCVVVGLGTVWTGLPWLLVPTVCGVVVAGTAWLLHRDLRLGRANAASRPAQHPSRQAQ